MHVPNVYLSQVACFSQVCGQHNAGECITVVDGFFVEIGVYTLSGIAWYLLLSKMFGDLTKRISDWQVNDDINGPRDESYNLPDVLPVSNLPR